MKNDFSDEPCGRLWRLEVARNMTVYEAGALKSEWEQLLAQRACIELDLSQVAEMDAAGLQLLVSARRTAAEGGGQLHVGACSPAVRRCIGLFNLGGLFDLPARAAGKAGEVEVRGENLVRGSGFTQIAAGDE